MIPAECCHRCEAKSLSAWKRLVGSRRSSSRPYTHSDSSKRQPLSDRVTSYLFDKMTTSPFERVRKEEDKEEPLSDRERGGT